jgi:hypothetical protein
MTEIPLYLAWMLLINPQSGEVEKTLPYLQEDGKQHAPMQAEECNAHITGVPFQLVEGKAVFLICERVS